MSLITLIIIGLAAGFLATRLMDLETNVVVTMAIGVLGALLGGLILRILLAVMGWMAGFIGAVIGAMLLIWAWRTYGPKS